MKAVNLIPSDLRGRSSRPVTRSQGGAYAVLGVLAGLALLALLYGIARHQVSNRRAQVASLAAKAQSVSAAAAQLAPYTNFIAVREQRMQTVAQIVDSRFDWAHAMHEFGRVLPRGASISSLSGTAGAASPSASGTSTSAGVSATPPGTVPIFTLSGCATSQAEVALTLQRLRLIEGASEVTLQSSVKATAGGGAGAASSGAGSASCPAGDPSYAAQVSFDPLPSESSIGATKLTSSTGAQP